MAIRHRIRALRKEQDLRAEDMAQALGISRPFYTLLEGGKRRLSAEHIEKIARTLRMSVGELYGDSPYPESSRATLDPAYVRPINTPELKKQLQPLFAEQTDEVVDCIQMWVAAPRRLKQALKESYKEKKHRR